MKTIIKKSTTICAIMAALFLISCSNSKTVSDKNSMEADSTTVYACPMHPDVTGKKDDKCAKCGMSLELVQQADEKGEKSNDEEKHDAHHN